MGPTRWVRSADLEARVERITSSTVTVRWAAGRQVRHVDIELAAEPGFDDALRVARADERSGTHTVRALAADVDVFLRVRVRSPKGAQSVVLQAHTVGGADAAELDTHLRAVRGVAPDVIELVLAGGDGASWARSDWKVKRRDGEAIAVRQVHRHSVPVAQPDYEVGQGARSNIDVVEVDHHIFLRLGEEIGPRELLRVRGPEDLSALIPFSDRRMVTETVQLNQVGYSPRATRRWAYVSAWMGDGGGLGLQGFPARAEVLRMPAAATDARDDVVARVAIEPRAARDEDAGTEVRQIDLSSLEADERPLRVRIPGVGVSWPTRISERGVFEAFYVAARGLFHNRWAGDLRSDCTEWSRPPDHTHVYTGNQDDPKRMVPEDTPRAGRRELRGGYHDAGDFDQRPSHTVVPQLLMRVYEISPDHFTDRQLTLPESGNGIPDLLDEALWGVAAWEQLQEEDGGVRMGVESYRHPDGYDFAHNDELPYWTYARDAGTSARAAGLFAQAARLVDSYDEERAEGLRKRAERALRYARRHDASPAFVLYGAGELYRLTGHSRYKRAFDEAWAAAGTPGRFPPYARDHLALGDYVEGARVMPDYVLGYVLQGQPSDPIREQVEHIVAREADEAADRFLDSRYAHRNGRIYPEGIGWGRATMMGRYLDFVFARLSLGDLSEEKRQRYFDALSVASDYVLGANPLGMVFMTGLGSVRPRRPLHLDSLAWLERGRPPVPGIPVYGPVMSLPNVHYYRPAASEFHPPFEDHPRTRRYGDVRTFVNTNECTVWECQAPLVELLAALVGSDMSPPRDRFAGGSADAHLQR